MRAKLSKKQRLAYKVVKGQGLVYPGNTQRAKDLARARTTEQLEAMYVAQRIEGKR